MIRLSTPATTRHSSILASLRTVPRLPATAMKPTIKGNVNVQRGNYNVVLCERGIRTFETATRNTLDLNAVPLLKEWTHLPVLVDPSHGTGIWSLVTPMALASVAAGADGLLIEVHPNPAVARSDGPQQLRPDRFASLMKSLAPVAEAVGRSL